MSHIEVFQFRNYSGEGVCSTVRLGDETFELQCGNEKLMRRFGVDLSTNRLGDNIKELELEGKTVVCFCIDSVPRLVISLEEEHIAKPEARAAIRYLRDTLGLKVGIITGVNESSAMRVAKHLGIEPERVTARAYPH